MELGPRVVVVKQGEYGASLFTEDGFFSLPAYPLETVIDPTGAGDSFAGGFFGYLDSQGGATDDGTLRRAMTYGSASRRSGSRSSAASAPSASPARRSRSATRRSGR